jgi:hypothetical protein
VNLETTMQNALDLRPDVSAIACLDGHAGLLLGMYVRGDVSRELVEVAAFSATQLCARPRFLEDADGLDDVDGRDEPSCAFVASDEWIHAYARVPAQPELVVVGLAKAGTNLALFRTWLGDLAGQVGRAA